VAIAGSENFHKLYDLTARVLPEAARAPRSSAEAHLEWACRGALERLGVATAEEISAYFAAITAAEARQWCRQAATDGKIVEVTVAGDGPGRPRPAYAPPDWEDRAAALPTPGNRIRLLPPFDPLLHDRRRTLRLFGFDYRFEAFVPAARRKHGYYVMPILEGEHLIGRLDAKLDRRGQQLVVRGLWWEKGPPGLRRRAAFAAALDRLARSIGAAGWEVSGSSPDQG
jgi:uncharacterized protein YcaQ